MRVTAPGSHSWHVAAQRGKEQSVTPKPRFAPAQLCGPPRVGEGPHSRCQIQISTSAVHQPLDLGQVA